MVDPTTVDTDALLAALAVRPIDHAALARARKGTFAMVRSSINSGAVIMVLIFSAVVPWILFQFVWSLIVFAPIIVGYAIYLAVRTIAAGGRLDQAYDASAATLEPLRASSYWNGVSVGGGADGVVVERERDGGLHWMRDLWLAEKLADAAATPPATIRA